MKTKHFLCMIDSSDAEVILNVIRKAFKYEFATEGHGQSSALIVIGSCNVAARKAMESFVIGMADAADAMANGVV